MYNKVDKFIIFSKKFARLNDKGQDTLVKVAYELLKTHQGAKNASIALISDDEANTPDGFNNNETNTIC
ncbi:MAG: hypothetical protein LBD18_02605 [Treponema sp.]|jgi:hypothetical protein|nr:hypothetical protein [Treponema sp.]